MTAVVVLAVVLAVVVAGLLGLLWWETSHGLLVCRRRKQVIVTLKTGDGFAGVLYAVDRDALVLRQAEALGAGPNGAAVVVDGEAVLLRADVAYVQVL